MESSEILLVETQKRTGEPILLRYLPHRYMPWRRAKQNIDKRVNHVLNSGNTSKVNMLKALQNAHEGDRKMSREELRDEILTLLVAGPWNHGLYHVMGTLWSGQKPRGPRQNCGRNICYRFGFTPHDTCAKLASLHIGWLGRRLFVSNPTVVGIVRQAETDTTLGGKYNVPAGTVVNVLNGIMAHSAEVWGKDSMTYRPERMEKGYPEEYMPFGFGGRTCIGKRLAYAEGVYLLAFLVKNFRFQIEATAPAPTSRVTLTHHADEGIHLTVLRAIDRQLQQHHEDNSAIPHFATRWWAVHFKEEDCPRQERWLVTRVI